nr:MAG TPA: hypothetical protein [Caudoviricetes sp.]
MRRILQSLCLKIRRIENLSQKTNLNKLLCTDFLQQ